MAQKELIYVYTNTWRILHWIVFFATIGLSITGYYIAAPYFWGIPGEAANTFTMANMRFLHFLCANLYFGVAFIIGTYITFFSTYHAHWKDMLPSPKNIKGGWIQFKYYWRLKGERTDYMWVDPVDGFIFLLFHILFLHQLITGFALYVPAYLTKWWWPTLLHLTTDWIYWIYSDLQGIRFWHHLGLWCIITLFIIHVYLQIWKTIKLKNSNIASIFGGYRYRDVNFK
ncbi:MAG: cytochrome b/b6 domain-containing protein [Nitrospinae bacterium]|nr:cytochrome b/b6 domain-containing protein [Nitrospinota bacterium]